MLYLILAALLVALDQAVKFLVRAHIPLGGSLPVLPGVLDLTYVQNTGAAFSLFTGHTWLLTIISLAVSVALAAALVKGVLRHPFARCALAVVLAGAVGNLIDRAFRGFVVDMFNVLFMRFAVFNVADIGVTCGFVLFLVGVIVSWRHEDRLSAELAASDGEGEGTDAR